MVARTSGGREVASSILVPPTNCLGMAQSGSARRSGRRGRWFKSSYPDHVYLTSWRMDAVSKIPFYGGYFCSCSIDASSPANFKNGLGGCNTYNNRQALRVLAIVWLCYYLQFALDDFALRYYFALTDACALDYCRHYNRPNLLMFLNLARLETQARTVEHYTPDTTQRTVFPRNFKL